MMRNKIKIISIFKRKLKMIKMNFRYMSKREEQFMKMRSKKKSR